MVRSATVKINGLTSTAPPARNPETTTVLDALRSPATRH